MTLAEFLYAAAGNVPLWNRPAIVILFGVAAIGFLLWWDLMMGDDQ